MPDCSLSDLWILSECSLIALRLLWLLSDLERWRLTALDNFVPQGRTDGWTLALLELLSEPKIPGVNLRIAPFLRLDVELELSLSLTIYSCWSCSFYISFIQETFFLLWSILIHQSWVVTQSFDWLECYFLTWEISWSSFYREHSKSFIFINIFYDCLQHWRAVC